MFNKLSSDAGAGDLGPHFTWGLGLVVGARCWAVEAGLENPRESSTGWKSTHVPRFPK